MGKFIDCNHPGTIYSGEEAHFDYVLSEGGFPRWISDAQAMRLMQAPLCEDDPRPWSYRSAPDWWAEAFLETL